MTEPSQLGKPNSENRSRIVSPLFGEISSDLLIRGDLHACPYLPGRAAREEFFITPELNPELYHDLMDHCFRRSGTVLYRPVCEDCYECRPIRVRVADFIPSKSQRRLLRKNEDVEIILRSPGFTTEKLKIYCDYLKSQHNCRDENMRDDFRRFLYMSCVNSVELEYRVRGALVAVSIVDVCSRSLSSVYVYYDPAFSSRSLGTFSALQEIVLCRRQDIPYYYIGFYIAQCPSMSYKARFRPHELLNSNLAWIPDESQVTWPQVG
jgi:leucyl-tRNA---protein transferase